MNRNEQWNNFFAVEKNISYDNHLQKTLELAHSIQQSDKAGPRISLGNMIMKQLKFFALKIWLIQGMVLALLCTLFFHLYSAFPVYSADSFGWEQRNISRFLCLCGSIVVISTIPLMLRSARCQMMELEQSTYFSLRGNLLSQLLFIGIGDSGMLAALSLLAGRYQITGGTIFLSLVVPYLTAAVSCLMLWIRAKPSFFHNTGVILCMVSACLIYEAVEKSILLLSATSFCLWIAYAFVCIGILYCECRKLYIQCTIEEMIL